MGGMFMNSELIDISPTRKEIKIEIDTDSIRDEYNRVSNLYAKQVNVAGFRRGRAPVDVVQRQYKKEIASEVIRNIVPKAITEAIQGHDLHPINEPEIHFENPDSLDKLGKQPINIHAHVEVFPDIELSNYKGLELVRRTRQVKDEDVEDLIQNLREEHASLQPVEDRPAQIGDTISIDLVGKFIQTPEEEDIKVEDVEIVLGGEGVVKEFNDNLVGTRPDDERTFTVNYPEDFSSKGLAGKQVEYKVKVTAVRIKELPEVDNEWAQSVVSEVETVEGLREKLTNVLKDSAKTESNQLLRNELIDRLIKDYPIEVPETLIQTGMKNLLQETINNMLYRGINPRDPEIDWESIREKLRLEAEKQLRASLILEHIAQAENISVSDQEIEDEIKAMADQYQRPIEQVRAALTKEEGVRSIANRLRIRKTIELLIDNAQVTEGEWKEKEANDPSLDKTSAQDEVANEASASQTE
jgi:trigger factor